MRKNGVTVGHKRILCQIAVHAVVHGSKALCQIALALLLASLQIYFEYLCGVFRTLMLYKGEKETPIVRTVVRIGTSQKQNHHTACSLLLVTLVIRTTMNTRILNAAHVNVLSYICDDRLWLFTASVFDLRNRNPLIHASKTSLLNGVL